MKFTGLIKEHCEPNTYLEDLSLSIFDMIDKDHIQNFDKENVIKYLNEGKTIASEMRLISSMLPNSRILGGITYLTDGIWIWPNYLSEYLLETDLIIEKSFLKTISENNYILPQSIDVEKVISFFKEKSCKFNSKEITQVYQTKKINSKLEKQFIKELEWFYRNYGNEWSLDDFSNKIKNNKDKLKNTLVYLSEKKIIEIKKEDEYSFTILKLPG